jgi:hypothetical protein
LPPTIAYGERIIGAKLAGRNTKTLYVTRAWETMELGESPASRPPCLKTVDIALSIAHLIKSKNVSVRFGL